MLRSGIGALGVVLLLSACGVDSEGAGAGSSADTNVPSDAVAPDAVIISTQAPQHYGPAIAAARQAQGEVRAPESVG